MAILVLQHHPAEHPARLGATLRDFGHRLRVIELNDGDALPPDLDDVDGIITLGGPMNVDQAGKHPWLEAEFELVRRAHEQGVPLVGLCLGAQVIAHALGGKVQPMDQPEVGWLAVRQSFPGTIDPLLSGIPWRTTQFHLHGQQITDLPEGGVPLAGSDATPIQAFKVGLRTYAFQYHFELARPDIDAMLEASRTWVEPTVSIDQVRDATADHYELYRHLGDRLGSNIANLLMPLDKRLAGKRGADESWLPN